MIIEIKLIIDIHTKHVYRIFYGWKGETVISFFLILKLDAWSRSQSFRYYDTINLQLQPHQLRIFLKYKDQCQIDIFDAHLHIHSIWPV